MILWMQEKENLIHLVEVSLENTWGVLTSFSDLERTCKLVGASQSVALVLWVVMFTS